VADAINLVSPNGGTPTGAHTQTILGAHIDKLNATKGTPGYGQIKPLDMNLHHRWRAQYVLLTNFHTSFLTHHF
jgi:hypothetical protein